MLVYILYVFIFVTCYYTNTYFIKISFSKWAHAKYVTLAKLSQCHLIVHVC